MSIVAKACSYRNQYMSILLGQTVAKNVHQVMYRIYLLHFVKYIEELAP